MLSSLTPIAPLPAATATPPAAGGGAAAETADAPEGGSFAQALEQAGSPASPHAPAAAARARGAAAKAAAGAAERSRADQRPAVAGDKAVADADPLAASTETDESGRAADDEAATPGGVGALLADLQARAPTAPTVARGAATADTTTPTGPVPSKADAAQATDALRPGAGHRSLDTPHAAADRRAPQSTAAAGRPDTAPAALVDRLALMPAAATTAAADNSALARAEALVAAAAPLSTAAVPLPAAAPATLAPATATPPAEATLSAHPASAEFAPQLGATLSTFVRDGIEHARLHLNPAELGPVQVQIQLDGANAQVMLGAEHALTRQALEQSLPLLAGTLREAGLTLAGGGVFEQARQGQGGDPGNPGGRGTPARGAGRSEAAEPPARAVLRSRGVVDLVA